MRATCLETSSGRVAVSRKGGRGPLWRLAATGGSGTGPNTGALFSQQPRPVLGGIFVLAADVAVCRRSRSRPRVAGRVRRFGDLLTLPDSFAFADDLAGPSQSGVLGPEGEGLEGSAPTPGLGVVGGEKRTGRGRLAEESGDLETRPRGVLDTRFPSGVSARNWANESLAGDVFSSSFSGEKWNGDTFAADFGTGVSFGFLRIERGIRASEIGVFDWTGV